MAAKREEMTSGELLIEAVRALDVARVRKLIADGADVNEIPEEESPLGVAAEVGNDAIVDALLKAGAEPGVGGLYVPLCRAAEKGHAKIVRQLLDAGADPNEAEEEGVTPLMLAAATGRLDIAKMLVAAKADTRVRDDDGKSAILYARGKSDLIRYLTPMSRIEDVDAVVREAAAASTLAKQAKPARSLVDAAERGDLVAIDALIKSGANVNQPDEYGRTPLHHATFHGHLEAARRLHAAGAKIDARDAWKQTPLLHAMDNKPDRRAVIKWLIENGADVRAKDVHGQNIMTLASRYLPPHGLGEPADQQAMLALLREVGLTSASAGELTKAAGEGDVDVMKRLLASGTSPDAVDEQERTPLYMAVSRRQPEIVAMLLKAKADPNKPIGRDDEVDTMWGGRSKPCPKCGEPFIAWTRHRKCPACGHAFDTVTTFGPESSGWPLVFSWTNGWTPLMAAARVNETALAKRLLDAGAMIDAGRADATPLMCACVYGHLEMAKFLIDHGAKVNAVCKETGSRVTTNITPIQIAAEEANFELMELLWSAGAKSQDKDATRLVAAANNGDVARVKSLLKAGTDVNSVDPFTNDTAIIAAAKSGRAEVVRALLATGAPVTTPPPKRGIAPLLMACVTLFDRSQREAMTDVDVAGYVETARALVDAGAPVKVAMFGQTPLGLAEQAKCGPLVELLKQALAKQPPAPAAKAKTKSKAKKKSP